MTNPPEDQALTVQGEGNGASGNDPTRGSTDWRPIDSAPRDGTRVDLWVVFETGARRATDTHFDTDLGEWWVSDHHHAGHYVPRPRPTHWMPLPDPPPTPANETGEG
jgi:hypothetical protein